MQIEWVNHASFVVRTEGVSLICDPWLDGPAFDNGWRLFAPTKLNPADFAGITHIWVSHEHPDHFHPPSLKRIPEDIRRRLTVLFHQTKDQRVVTACKSMGFQVQELPEHQLVALAPGFTVECGCQGLLDSWLGVRADGRALLNMNDCVFNSDTELAAVRDRVGGVDVLFSQFSYAQWIGNPEDTKSHKSYAEAKRREIRRQIEMFRPKWFVPFASFVYFSHAENCFMNAAVNHIADIHRYVTDDLKTPSIVLYPGDTWTLGAPHDSATSAARYERDFEAAVAAPPSTSPVISLTDLQSAAAKFRQRCFEKNNSFLLKRLPPANIRVADLGKDLCFSFASGLTETRFDQADIVLGSESLSYCFSFEWGGNTLEVNGRYQAPEKGDATKFFHIFRVAQYNASGQRLEKVLFSKVLARARKLVSFPA